MLAHTSKKCIICISCLPTPEIHRESMFLLLLDESNNSSLNSECFHITVSTFNTCIQELTSSFYCLNSYITVSFHIQFLSDPFSSAIQIFVLHIVNVFAPWSYVTTPIKKLLFTVLKKCPFPSSNLDFDFYPQAIFQRTQIFWLESITDQTDQVVALYSRGCFTPRRCLNSQRWFLQ